MPLYEYECPIHGYFTDIKTVEHRQKALCPECGLVCEKLISIPCISLPAGEGFTLSAHEKDIRSRYLRPDKSVGHKGDKFYEATMKDRGRV